MAYILNNLHLMHTWKPDVPCQLSLLLKKGSMKDVNFLKKGNFLKVKVCFTTGLRVVSLPERQAIVLIITTLFEPTKEYLLFSNTFFLAFSAVVFNWNLFIVLKECWLSSSKEQHFIILTYFTKLTCLLQEMSTKYCT